MPSLRNVTEKNLMIKQLSLSKVDVKNLMMERLSLRKAAANKAG
jgi:hypothetical protein